jgi:hypothetical protein
MSRLPPSPVSALAPAPGPAGCPRSHAPAETPPPRFPARASTRRTRLLASPHATSTTGPTRPPVRRSLCRPRHLALGPWARPDQRPPLRILVPASASPSPSRRGPHLAQHPPDHLPPPASSRSDQLPTVTSPARHPAHLRPTSASTRTRDDVAGLSSAHPVIDDIAPSHPWPPTPPWSRRGLVATRPTDHPPVPPSCVRCAPTAAAGRIVGLGRPRPLFAIRDSRPELPLPSASAWPHTWAARPVCAGSPAQQGRLITHQPVARTHPGADTPHRVGNALRTRPSLPCHEAPYPRAPRSTRGPRSPAPRP